MTGKENNPGGAAGVVNETLLGGAVSDVHNTSSSPDYVNLSDDHAAELRASAVSPGVAASAGVRTAYAVDELPDGARWIAERDGALPALVYPMVEVDGSPTWQVKPSPGSVTGRDGRVLKYVGPSRSDEQSQPPRLPVVHRCGGATKVLLVEGVKQALAVAGVAPDGFSVFRFTGVNSWMVAGEGGAPGSPTPHLGPAVAGLKVVIVGDADAATNVRVFDGLKALGRAAKDAGAKSVRYLRVPGAGKQGIDDVLGALPDHDARAATFAELLTSLSAKPAQLTADEANAMRRELRREESRRALDASRDAERVDVRVDGDWHLVAGEVARHLEARSGGRLLFKRGGDVVRSVPGSSGLTLRDVDRDGLHRAALEVVRPTAVDASGAERVAGGLQRDLLGLVREHVCDLLPEVMRISSGPVVRPDGTIVTTNGYDAATGVLLDLDEDVQRIEVPESPTDAEVKAASDLLRLVLFESDDEAQRDGYDAWLFASEADRTHAMAMLITAVIRSSVPTAPLFLVDGLQRGVGKGFLPKVVYRIVHGLELASAPLRSDAESEKRVTADLRAGKSMIVLDEVNGDDRREHEAPPLAAPALLTALTTSVWSGRVLGKSETVELKQDAVWVGTGNNVAVPGDMVRRVLPIRLSTERPDPDSRNNFRHNDSWHAENRCELLAAVLTLVRAWYDRGQPADPSPAPLGFVGYGEWQRVVGGILALAGCTGFLSTVQALRAGADSEALDTREHLEWLEGVASQLKSAPRFSARDALLHRSLDPDAPPPYRKSWDELDGRKLSATWRSIAGRWFGGIRIVEDGLMHGNVRAWRIDTAVAGSPVAAVGSGAPAPAAGAPETLVVKDRRGVAQEHLRVAPEIDGIGLDELAGGVA